MSDSEETTYYDDMAEAWEEGGLGFRSGIGAATGTGGGGGAKKKKKKAAPTTVGRQRVGGTQAWGTTEQTCSKGCAKKCCSGAAKATPCM
jgi:hypothetical protein